MKPLKELPEAEPGYAWNVKAKKTSLAGELVDPSLEPGGHRRAFVDYAEQYHALKWNVLELHFLCLLSDMPFIHRPKFVLAPIDYLAGTGFQVHPARRVPEDQRRLVGERAADERRRMREAVAAVDVGGVFLSRVQQLPLALSNKFSCCLTYLHNELVTALKNFGNNHRLRYARTFFGAFFVERLIRQRLHIPASAAITDSDEVRRQAASLHDLARALLEAESGHISSLAFEFVYRPMHSHRLEADQPAMDLLRSLLPSTRDVSQGGGLAYLPMFVKILRRVEPLYALLGMEWDSDRPHLNIGHIPGAAPLDCAILYHLVLSEAQRAWARETYREWYYVEPNGRVTPKHMQEIIFKMVFKESALEYQDGDIMDNYGRSDGKSLSINFLRQSKTRMFKFLNIETTGLAVASADIDKLGNPHMAPYLSEYPDEAIDRLQDFVPVADDPNMENNAFFVLLRSDVARMMSPPIRPPLVDTAPALPPVEVAAEVPAADAPQPLPPRPPFVGPSPDESPISSRMTRAARYNKVYKKLKYKRQAWKAQMRGDHSIKSVEAQLMALHFTIDLAAYRTQLTQRLALVDLLFDRYREMKWRQARFETFCRLRRYEASCLRAFEKWVGCPLSKVILGIGHWTPTRWFLKRMKKGSVFVKGVAELYRRCGASVVRVDESYSSCRCSPCGVLGRVGENSDYMTLPVVARTNLTREADKRRQLDAKQAVKKADRQRERSRREAASGGILPNNQTNNGTPHRRQCDRTSSCRSSCRGSSCRGSSC